MKVFFLIAMVLLVANAVNAQQVEVSTNYLMRSDYVDGNDDHIGRGDMMRYSLRYTQPLSTKTNDKGMPTLWSMTISGNYSRLDNEGQAATENPDEVLNANLAWAWIICQDNTVSMVRRLK